MMRKILLSCVGTAISLMPFLVQPAFCQHGGSDQDIKAAPPKQSPKQAYQDATDMVLDAPVKLSFQSVSFQIRPPRGYTMKTQEAPYGFIYAWQGPLREDDTCASFMVNIMCAPPEEKKAASLDQVLESMARGIAAHREKWHQNPVEHFVLNGRPFARIYWDGVEPTRQLKMRGYQYATAVGRDFVIFASQDIVPLDKISLPLGERSLETFKL